MPTSGPRTFAILGSGALGGLYGSMLAKAGFDVHFLLRSDFEHVSRHGWKIESHYGDFKLPDVHAHASVESMPPCDVTIVGLKTTQNDQLKDLLPQPTSGGGDVLVLQNGLDMEADSAAVVGVDRVLGGCCFLCSNKVGPGHIRHIDYGKIAFGEYGMEPPSVTLRGERLCDALVQAGIDAVLEPDLQLTRWRKLMWNIPFNGLSVVLNASTKELVEDTSSLDLVAEVIAEVHQAAAACDAAIPEKMMQQTIDVTKAMVPYDSSMRIDYLNRKPMEVEAIFGNPLRAAKRQGVAMPKVEMLYQELKFIDARNRSAV
ncbi:MAG: putative 2-dehydropantoate 2-reductase [Rubripirellula sp.]